MSYLDVRHWYEDPPDEIDMREKEIADTKAHLKQLTGIDVDEIIAQERERCALIAENEPELEGPMPEANRIMAARVSLEDHLRATIRATKTSIARKIRGV